MKKIQRKKLSGSRQFVEQPLIDYLKSVNDSQTAQQTSTKEALTAQQTSTKEPLTAQHTAMKEMLTAQLSAFKETVEAGNQHRKDALAAQQIAHKEQAKLLQFVIVMIIGFGGSILT